MEFSRQVDGRAPYLPVGFRVLHELQAFPDLRFHLMNMCNGVHRPRISRVNGQSLRGQGEGRTNQDDVSVSLPGDKVSQLQGHQGPGLCLKVTTPETRP